MFDRHDKGANNMTILVIGSTGTIGSLVVRQLTDRGAEVRALSKDPAKAKFPAGVTPVKGDLMDVDSMRAALAGTDTLFLLNAVVPDELTQALITLDLASEAGIKRVVYFSVFNGDVFGDVPHFSGKYTVERMIEQFDIPATILRPAYFFQNDVSLKEAVLGHGVYPMPIGSIGVSMVDARDIAEIAALSLVQRENAAEPLPRETIEIVGPDILTGEAIAAIWSEALGRSVSYAGDDLAAFEQRFRASAPAWMAYDMRMMLRGFQRDGMVAKRGNVDRLTGLLGRPLRNYSSFALETMKRWQP
jgi:uncharacterized protein YbjT (DUF2867 family)